MNTLGKGTDTNLMKNRVVSYIEKYPSNYLKYMIRDPVLQSFLKQIKGKTCAEKVYRFLDAQNIPKRNKKKVLKYLRQSKSQLRQDLWVLSQLDFKDRGYFVEIGAGDVKNYNFSNTEILEKHFGWTGVIVEPIPLHINHLEKNRNCDIETQPICSETGKIVDFMVHPGGSLSGIADYLEESILNSCVKNLSLPTLSLVDLLKKYNSPKVIDYLSIDTEGSEYEILKTMDFTKYKFRTITVEHNKGLRKTEIFRLLTKNEYTLLQTDWPYFEDWYIHNSVLVS